MDDLNDMEHHSAGATVRHKSPFDSLPSHKNEAALSADFIKKWAVPFYMKIAYDIDEVWIEEIENIKGEITPEICRLLLGDFNWRTRLVGAYFAAVKGYEDMVDIIGVHLLKSEVCCVGHIYALTLAFFETPKSVDFLNRYLDYYLTKPELYFDQQFVMEAVFYLDKAKGTNHFDKHLPGWTLLEQKRKSLSRQHTLQTAKLLEKQDGKAAAAEYLRSLSAHTNEKPETFTGEYFSKQVSILKNLHQYGIW